MNLLSLDSPEAKRLRTIREKLAANRQTTDALGAARLTDAEIATRVSGALDECTRYASDHLGRLAFDSDQRFAAADALSETLKKPAGIVALLREQLEPALVAAVIADMEAH